MKPDLDTKPSKKRKKAAIDDSNPPDVIESIIDEFEHEAELTQFYSETEQRIRLDEIPELKSKPVYIALDVKEVINKLDLKKEVVLTMLN